MTGFDAAAATYDRSRRALIPDYEDLYGAALAALQLEGAGAPRVLDLGAGTGGFAELVAHAVPDAYVELADVSDAMLDKAREKFAGDERFGFRLVDIVSDPIGDGWDAIISSFVIHHLEHADKRKVFSKVCAALKPGARFVNVDQVQACSQAVQDIHLRKWKKDALAAGAHPKDLEDGVARMQEMDINAELDDQILWLEEAGFAHVETVYRNYFWAVFVAQKT